MRIVIAGGRDFDDMDMLHEQMARVRAWIQSELKTDIEEVVGGGAAGADTLGQLWAGEQGLPYTSMLAEWRKHGRAAGPLRNERMALYVGLKGGVVVFWDGVSRGSKNMIMQGNKHCMHTWVKRY